MTDSKRLKTKKKVLYLLTSGFMIVLLTVVVSYRKYTNLKSVTRDDGKSVKYITGEFTQFNETIFKNVSTYFGTMESTTTLKACYDFQYVGGVWGPPDPEYLCSHGLKTRINTTSTEDFSLSIVKASKYLESYDYETYSHVMQSPKACLENSTRDTSKHCFYSVLNPDSKWGHTEKGCIVLINYSPPSQGSDSAMLQATCSIRAQEKPEGYASIASSDYYKWLD